MFCYDNLNKTLPHLLSSHTNRFGTVINLIKRLKKHKHELCRCAMCTFFIFYKYISDIQADNHSQYKRDEYKMIEKISKLEKKEVSGTCSLMELQSLVVETSSSSESNRPSWLSKSSASTLLTDSWSRRSSPSVDRLQMEGERRVLLAVQCPPRGC